MAVELPSGSRKTANPVKTLLSNLTVPNVLGFYGTRFEKSFLHNFHQISDCNDEIKTILTLNIIIYDPYVIEYSITCAVPLSESQEIVLKSKLVNEKELGNQKLRN